MPTMRDLIESPALGLVVHSGAEQLDRPLHWVHVTELPDPGPYLREGELVLTNGLWLAPDRDPADYVARVAASGAIGIVFGLLEERPAVPASLREACETAALPLLALPIDVPFTAVSEAVARLQGAERQRELAQSVTRGDALARALAEGAALEDVVRLLTRDHLLPVALVDHAGRVLAAEGMDAAALDGAELAAAMDGPARAELRLADGSVAALFAVGALGEVEALLICLRPLVDLAPAERGALQQTARFLTLELTRRQALAAIESRFAGELLEMVYDDARRGRELPGRLRSFALDPDGRLAALSVAFAGDGPATPAGLSAAIARALLQEGVAAVVPQGSEDAVAIAGWPHDAPALRACAERVAERLAGEWPRRRPVVGVGRLADGHGGLRRCLVEAREARRALQRRGGDARVATFEHVGSHRMLLALHDPQTLADFADAVLGPIREYDARQGAALEETLRAFLARDGRWTATADGLHVHVNTLRNRIARIELLTGRRLSATEDRVDLFLAVQADAFA